MKAAIFALVLAAAQPGKVAVIFDPDVGLAREIAQALASYPSLQTVALRPGEKWPGKTAPDKVVAMGDKAYAHAEVLWPHANTPGNIAVLWNKSSLPQKWQGFTWHPAHSCWSAALERKHPGREVIVIAGSEDHEAADLAKHVDGSLVQGSRKTVWRGLRQALQDSPNAVALLRSSPEFADPIWLASFLRLMGAYQIPVMSDGPNLASMDGISTVTLEPNHIAQTIAFALETSQMRRGSSGQEMLCRFSL